MTNADVTNTSAQSRYAASTRAHRDACEVLVGGVNSPVRAYAPVGRDPVTVDTGQGAYVRDIDGNWYVDYVNSYGPLILGHAPDPVVAAVTDAAARGTSFGMPTQAETKLARLVVDALPSIERVRFVNSGTEAVMSAIRLARAATARPKVIKMTGCFHGHSDALLVQAGSGAATLGTPSSPGIPESVTGHTLLAPYNDIQAVENILAAHPDDVAAIVVEPVAGNMGCVPPEPGYLPALRSLCDKYSSLLIFDEVMTGFRVAWGGAQSLYNVTPDLTCLGKVVGGGLPCAAYGGPAHLMRQIAPEGPVYQSGTLSGNPLAMAAGLATLSALQSGEAYDRLEQLGATMATGLENAASRTGTPARVSRVGSMISLFFTSRDVRTYDDASACDTERFARFFNAMLDAGIMLPPSQYETWFLSTAHTEETLARTIDAAEQAMR